jgi:hypothetical protein
MEKAIPWRQCLPDPKRKKSDGIITRALLATQNWNLLEAIPIHKGSTKKKKKNHAKMTIVFWIWTRDLL